VAYDSADWLKLNARLVRKLNPNTSYSWIVVENSKQDSSKRLNPDNRDFDIIQGADCEQVPYAAASYHHGTGLNLGIKTVTSRFLLVLDPDFYVIQDDWIAKILDYMKQESVSILGAPWHPQRYKKWRYFPCAHCTFFDLSKIDSQALDFRPDYDAYPRLDKKHSKYTKKLIKLVDPLKLRERRFIGHSADTGYRIFQLFFNNTQHKTRCLTPVFSPSIFSQLYDAPFNDASSLIPRAVDYYSPSSFTDFGLPDLRRLECEEFLWRNEPFGFHVRSFPKRQKAADTLPVILNKIENFTAELL
jgi:hypothetical protein